MVDNLILAYRARVYDLKWERLKKMIAQNKSSFLILVGVILLSIIATVYVIYLQSAASALIYLLAVGLLAHWSDRFLVKNYQQYILNGQNRINQVISVLKTEIPGHNFYEVKQVNMILERLEERIERNIPFKDFKSSLSSFGKTVVFPTVAFIAGIYSNKIEEAGFQVVLINGGIIIITLGILGFATNSSLQFIRRIAFREYDAAIAFREDLLDIKGMLLENLSDEAIIPST